METLRTFFFFANPFKISHPGDDSFVPSLPDDSTCHNAACHKPLISFVVARVAAGARPTRDQIPVALGPSLQSHARTPSGSETDAQRSEAQDTAAPGTHKFGEHIY